MPPRPTVYPSGGAFAIASAPSTPPAPALFSTTKDCPDSSLSFWQSTRESVSVAPPAGKPLTYFTCRMGQASAARPTRGARNGAATKELMVASARRRSIDSGIGVLPSRAMRRVAAWLLLSSLLPVLDISTRGEARSVDLSLGGAGEGAKSAFRDKKPTTTSRGFLPDGKCAQAGSDACHATVLSEWRNRRFRCGLVRS